MFEPGDQQQALILLVQVGIIADENTIPDGLFYDRMSALFNLDHVTVIHLRLDIAVLFADLRKRSQHVKRCDGPGGFLDLGRYTAAGFVAALKTDRIPAG